MTRILSALVAAVALHAAAAFTAPSLHHARAPCRTRTTTPLRAGGWGNNQERPVLDAEFGSDNVYDSYEIEDRGQFMQRVNDERKSLRIKKAADLLEVARIAGVELKRKEKDPEKMDMFDAEDFSEDDDYLDVSV
ncbi:hypothetical protein ACHAXT_006197 [Thalassiosira profunda]